MASAQPKIKSKVRCLDGDAGEIVHVIADPISLEISHIVVRANLDNADQLAIGTVTTKPVSVVAGLRANPSASRNSKSRQAR